MQFSTGLGRVARHRQQDDGLAGRQTLRQEPRRSGQVGRLAVELKESELPRHRLTLVLLPGTFAVCRLAADAAVPPWADVGFSSVVRTAEELSVVCREDAVPDVVRREGGRRVLRVAGTLDFSLVGVLASLLASLADAGVSVFCISTFDTDYLLVRDLDLATAMAALTAAGHEVRAEG